jgi:UTP--glucose-1-phosphate uridylyltransferase
MVEVYRRYRCSVLAVEPVPEWETEKYGIVKATRLEDRISRIDNIVEKPLPSAAPSNLGVVGRYILSPRIFELLEKTVPGAGGEIQLTDAIEALLAIERVLAFEFSGRRYDCGSKLGYLEANVEYALNHGELKDKFRSYLEEVL